MCHLMWSKLRKSITISNLNLPWVKAQSKEMSSFSFCEQFWGKWPNRALVENQILKKCRRKYHLGGGTTNSVYFYLYRIEAYEIACFDRNRGTDIGKTFIPNFASLFLSPLCPQLKNRLTQVSGTKQVGHPHILREGESEIIEWDYEKIVSGWSSASCSHSLSLHLGLLFVTKEGWI